MIPAIAIKLLTSKTLWYSVAIGAVATTAYFWARSNGYEAAEKKLKPLIEETAKERDLWKTSYEELRDDVKLKAKAYAAAITDQETHNQKVLVLLGNKLAQFRAENAKLKGVLSDTQSFVSPQSDAACVVPVGFVQLHDAAATGNPALAAAAARSVAGNAEAPSGVALSKVAETTVENYSLAREWREQLLAWQDWYTRWQGWYSNWKVQQIPLDKPSTAR